MCPSKTFNGEGDTFTVIDIVVDGSDNPPHDVEIRTIGSYEAWAWLTKPEARKLAKWILENTDESD